MLKQGWPAWARPDALWDLIRLASPIAVSRASMMLMGLTDTIILSRNVAEELPYVLMGWFPVSIFMGISIGLLLGVSILTAEMAGRGERHNSGRIFRRGLLISLIFGGSGTIALLAIAHPVFVLLGFEGDMLSGTVSATRLLGLGLMAHMLSNAAGSYLEALRRPLIPTIALYGGVVVNLFIDLALVAGWWGFPQMGADGVAIATTGTRWFLALLLLVLVAVFTPGFRKSTAAAKGEASRQLQLGYGMAASSVAEWGAFNFTFVIATWVNVVSGSVYGMIVQTIGFVFMAFLGLGTATNVRVSEHIGGGRQSLAADAARQGIFGTVVVGVVAALIMLIMPGQIALVFVRADEAINGIDLLPVLTGLIALASVVVVFDGLQNVASMASRALGSVWPPSIIHIGSYVFGMLPLAWFFGLHLNYGVQGILTGVIIASAVAGCMQLVFVEWLLRRAQEK